jgi:hypothetical protein
MSRLHHYLCKKQEDQPEMKPAALPTVNHCLCPRTSTGNHFKMIYRRIVCKEDAFRCVGSDRGVVGRDYCGGVDDEVVIHGVTTSK